MAIQVHARSVQATLSAPPALMSVVYMLMYGYLIPAQISCTTQAVRWRYAGSQSNVPLALGCSGEREQSAIQYRLSE